MMLLLIFLSLYSSSVKSEHFLADNATLQGSIIMSEGSDLKFVNADLDTKLNIRLLKVELDHSLQEKYHFFVPQIGNTVCQDQTEMCSQKFHMVNYDISKKCLSCCGAQVTASATHFYALFLANRPNIIATFLIEQRGSTSQMVSSFRLTDEATQSVHALQNGGRIFLHFQPVKVPRQVLSHCLLQNQDKFYYYSCEKINRFDEWNPGKLGWLKSDGQAVLRPSVATLSRYFQVHRLSCGTLEATFHGVLNVTNLEQHGKRIQLPEIEMSGDHGSSHLEHCRYHTVVWTNNELLS